MNETLKAMGEAARTAAEALGRLDTDVKNRALLAAADALCSRAQEILCENASDVATAEAAGMKQGLVDRLRLTEARIDAMAEGLRQIAALEDPVGETLEETVRPNGLRIVKRRVPFGVIGIIYESRPNVTADAFGLCFKTGNAVILRGGSDALRSNQCIVNILRGALLAQSLPADAVAIVGDTSRETAREMMRMKGYIDVLIPRGSAGLIQTVVENSTIPIIETGTGNCHVYVDESADMDMAVNIIMNAKTQRVGVCNACESLLVHEAAAETLMERLAGRLHEKRVEMRADETIMKYNPYAIAATEEDWGTEYLDYIISMKTVEDTDEAIRHINRYHTGHSDCIVTENAEHAERFLNEVDSAAVYWNASTRFTDGFEFGFGAEIGISTQKLHARGPMGLKELTSTKYVIYGDGQVRL